jgi:uroporphyrinogen decarboxylase
VSTTGMSSTSSADFRTLPLSEMEAIISRFDERVSGAMRKHSSSREWVRKAIRRQGAMRSPTRLKRISLDVILRYGDDLADLYCQFPDDVLWVQPYDYSVGHRPQGMEPINEIEVLTRSAEWTDEWGTRWGHAFGGVGATPVGNAIEDWSELDDYLAHHMPDPHAPGRLDRAKAVLAVHGDDKYCVALICPAIFERLHFLRGMENSLCDLADDDLELARLLEALRDNLIELIREWGQTKISGVYMTDDWGSQTGLIVSPALWRKHFKEHYRLIIDEIHRWDKDVIFHSCGNVMGLIPELVELGVDVLDPVQPVAMNVDEVGRQYGGQIAFCGGIDVQRLEDFTPQQVKDAIRHSIDALGKPFGNAYILAPANVLTPSVPFENIEAMFQACHEQ